MCLPGAQEFTPFTATVLETAYNRSGEVVRRNSIVQAVRSDASTVRAQTIEGPDKKSHAEQRFIVDLAAREEVAIDGFTETLTTSPIRLAIVAARQRPEPCTGDPLRTVMLGYEVTHEVVNIGAPSKTRLIREEHWRAPALGCFSLKTVLFVGPNEANLHLAKIDEVKTVVPGEPAAALFARPSGFTERSPMQRRQEFNKRFPDRPCPTCLMQGDAEADAVYYERQGDRGR